MPFNDLREYVSALQENDQLQSIEASVDWNLEVGAIIRRSYDLRESAPFFENIAGYDQGYRILGAPIGLSNRPGMEYARLALALCLPPNTGVEEIMNTFIDRKRNLLPPILVNSAPCKEEIHTGDAINLFEFPVPLIHDGDGGRYIGTWHTNITRDPDSGWVNWGMYRLMVHDAKTMGGIMTPNQHIGLHFYRKYEAKERPMEFAIAIGTEPVTALVSTIRTPPGVDEALLAGALRGAPVELVKCETVDLEVPASAEIVIEGRVMPGERMAEGPFGEYTGFRAGDRAPRPVYRVTAITHRRNPILPVSCMGVPVDDCAVIGHVTKAAEVLDDLRRRGFPVKMAFCPPAGVAHMIFVSTQVPYPGYVRHLAHAIWAANFGCYQVVILPEDVDVLNTDEVIWAIATRCHPIRGVHQISNVPGNPLLPFLSSEERSNLQAGYLLLDCTWPTEWPADMIPEKASFKDMWPETIQNKVITRWHEYGYQQGGSTSSD